METAVNSILAELKSKEENIEDIMNELKESNKTFLKSLIKANTYNTALRSNELEQYERSISAFIEQRHLDSETR